ncbi:hypothetical protein EJD97_025410, partial [Solanum chilense]
VNVVPHIDEYEVNNYQDEFDRDNQSLHDQEEDDETSEALIRAFSSPNSQNLEDEIQHLTLNQLLYPRGFQHEKFNFNNQDINHVSAGRPNTRIFSSRSSQ